MSNNTIASRLSLDTKEAIKEAAERLVKDYNDEIQNGNFAPKVSIPVVKGSDGKEDILLRVVLEELVNEYTSMSRDETFIRLRGCEDTMKAAITELTFPTIRIVDRKEGEDKAKIPVSSIEDAEKYIDLAKLHKFCNGIGHRKAWINEVEMLNFKLTLRQASELGIDGKEINSSYAMAELSKEMDLGKNPVCDKNLLATIQTIVEAMIGEGYKATKADVAFLKAVYAKKNRKALTVTCASHKNLRQYMAEICHRIMLEKEYEVEYKKAANK